MDRVESSQGIRLSLRVRLRSGGVSAPSTDHPWPCTHPPTQQKHCATQHTQLPAVVSGDTRV
eukprot:6552827-Prymnesium_polylepis.2